MILRALLALALIATSGIAVGQSDKGKGGSTLDTSGKPIPEQCAGLTGEKRQECIKKHAKR
ncbi:MAG: hypothetical protein ACT4P3_22105 [Betaproteobacteria bacterium]